MAEILSEECWPEALDALVAAPEHHTLLFENEVVRVLDTRIPPGERTALHTHRWPAVLYVFSWSTFVRRDAQERVTIDTRTLSPSPAPAQVVWTPPLAAHTLENVGAAELRVISVEMKQANCQASAGIP